MRVRKSRLMSRLPRYWPIVAVFVAMTILQASVAALSIQLLSTVRAYVAGGARLQFSFRLHAHRDRSAKRCRRLAPVPAAQLE